MPREVYCLIKRINKDIQVLWSSKDVKSYEKCMKLLKGTDWDEEIARVNRYEGYIIDS